MRSRIGPDLGYPTVYSHDTDVNFFFPRYDHCLAFLLLASVDKLFYLQLV